MLMPCEPRLLERCMFCHILPHFADLVVRGGSSVDWGG